MELNWLVEEYWIISWRNHAKPKSPTCATISSLRRTLLGLRSQWKTGVSDNEDNPMH